MSCFESQLIDCFQVITRLLFINMCYKTICKNISTRKETEETGDKLHMNTTNLNRKTIKIIAKSRKTFF